MAETEQTTLRVPVSVLRWAQETADRLGMNRSEILRMALLAGIDHIALPAHIMNPNDKEGANGDREQEAR